MLKVSYSNIGSGVCMNEWSRGSSIFSVVLKIKYNILEKVTSIKSNANVAALENFLGQITD